MSLAVFTDGSCVHNGTARARAAFACVWPDHPDHDVGLSLRDDETHTNNRAEFHAVLHALERADAIDPARKQTLTVYTDSMLLINTFTKWIENWKRRGWRKADGKMVMNLDLVTSIDAWLQLRTTAFQHVPAHTGGETFEARFNDKADRLARASVIIR
jgi:ribonuclease HI